MLQEKVKEILMSAGWYEGRKIDVSHYKKELEEYGYEFFDEAKAFFEEFGELTIRKMLPECYFDEDEEYEEYERYEEHTTSLEELIYDIKCITKFDEIGEKNLPIAIIADRNIGINISESGKIYTYEGLFNSNVEKLWNGLLGDDREKPLTWRELEEVIVKTLDNIMEENKI